MLICNLPRLTRVSYLLGITLPPYPRHVLSFWIVLHESITSTFDHFFGKSFTSSTIIHIQSYVLEPHTRVWYIYHRLVWTDSSTASSVWKPSTPQILPFLRTWRLSSMAAPVRQPINLSSLSTYIQCTVSEIKLPISVKQVRILLLSISCELLKLSLTVFPKRSLVMGNPIRLISSVQQMAENLCCERSLQASWSRRQHIKSNASTE